MTKVVRFKKPKSGDIYAVRPEHVAAVYGHEPLPKAKDPIHLECTLIADQRQGPDGRGRVRRGHQQAVGG